MGFAVWTSTVDVTGIKEDKALEVNAEISEVVVTTVKLVLTSCTSWAMVGNSSAELTVILVGDLYVISSIMGVESTIIGTTNVEVGNLDLIIAARVDIPVVGGCLLVTLTGVLEVEVGSSNSN